MGVFWAATPAIERALAAAGPQHFLGSLHAAEHASIALLPLLALCDRGDLGGISTPFHPQIGCGGVFVYEGHAGGVGISRRAFADLPEWLRRVHRLLVECDCEDGCPSCVQSPKCGNGNRPLDKAGARRVVAMLLGEEAVEGAGEPWTLRLEEGEPPVEEEPELAPVVGIAKGDEASGSSNGNGSGSLLARVLAPLSSREALIPSPRRGELDDGLAPISANGRGRGPFHWLGLHVRSLWRSIFRRRPRGVPPLVPGSPDGDTLLFDLETLRSAADVGGWGNAHRMGLAVAVVCRLEEERFEIFREGDARALAATLRAARLVIGYNVRRFDYRVLAGYTGADYNRLVPTLDLLEEVHRVLGFRLKLDDLAHATLGNGKTADGLQSLEWVRAGRLDLVEDYCRHDVEVLRDLYLFGRREGYVVWRDRDERRLRLPVRW